MLQSGSAKSDIQDSFRFSENGHFFCPFFIFGITFDPLKIAIFSKPFWEYIYINTVEPHMAGLIGRLLCRVFRGAVFGRHVWAPFCPPLHLMQIPETSDKTRYRSRKKIYII